MAADKELLNEFKELIETVSLEIIKEAQMKEVAKDVVTRSYKAEISDALEAISDEIERVKGELQTLDYISAEDIEQLIYGICEKNEASLKESEERIKHVVDETTKELYINHEKLRSEVATLSEQVQGQLADNNQIVDKNTKFLGGIKESFIEVETKTKKLFWINYGLIAIVILLLGFILIKGNHGA